MRHPALPDYRFIPLNSISQGKPTTRPWEDIAGRLDSCREEGGCRIVITKIIEGFREICSVEDSEDGKICKRLCE